jgi:AcrR family transcriptional regulator
MAGQSRKQQEFQARQADILLAASQVFAAKGFEATTIAEIAQRAEVGLGTVYQSFESKEALQRALLEEKAGRLLAHVETETRARPTQPAGVRRLAGIDLLVSEEQPGLWLGQTLSRRDQDIQSKRQSILAAAAAVFIRKGFSGAGMADIADEAEVATGSLYKFFPSKEDLYFTLIDEKIDEFSLRVKLETNRVSTVLEKIAGLIRATCSFFDANRAFLAFFMSTNSGFAVAIHPDFGERINRKLTAYLDWVAGLLAAGMQEGSLRVMDPQEMAAALVGMVNASTSRWIVAGDGQFPADRAQHITELFLKGAHQP